MARRPIYLTLDLEHLDPAGRFPRPLVAAVRIDAERRVAFGSTVHRALGVGELPPVPGPYEAGTHGLALRSEPDPRPLGALVDLYRELRRTVLHLGSGAGLPCAQIERGITEAWRELGGAAAAELDPPAEAIAVAAQRGTAFYNLVAGSTGLRRVVERAAVAAFLVDPDRPPALTPRSRLATALGQLLGGAAEAEGVLRGPSPAPGWLEWARRVTIDDSTMPELAHWRLVRRVAVRMAMLGEWLTPARVRGVSSADEWWVVHGTAMYRDLDALADALREPEQARDRAEASVGPGWGPSWVLRRAVILRNLRTVPA